MSAFTDSVDKILGAFSFESGNPIAIKNTYKNLLQKILLKQDFNLYSLKKQHIKCTNGNPCGSLPLYWCLNLLGYSTSLCIVGAPSQNQEGMHSSLPALLRKSAPAESEYNVKILFGYTQQINKDV